jgi:hypothetical protein
MENLAYGYETTNSDENKTSVKILPNKSKGSQTENQDILSGDSLQVYLQQIKRYKLLTREEEVELAQRVLENNDEEAVKPYSGGQFGSGAGCKKIRSQSRNQILLLRLILDQSLYVEVHYGELETCEDWNNSKPTQVVL